MSLVVALEALGRAAADVAGTAATAVARRPVQWRPTAALAWVRIRNGLRRLDFAEPPSRWS